VRAVFVGQAFDGWMTALEQLVGAGLGAGAMINFATASTAAARAHGPDLALAAVPVALSIARVSGQRAATAFFAAAATAAARLKEHTAFRTWLRTVEEVCNLAPESAVPFLQATDSTLAILDVIAYRAWALNGIRLGGDDPALRLGYFTQSDQALLRSFDRAPDDVALADCERSIKAFLAALWNYRPVIRPATIRPGGKAPRRAFFDGIIVRVPEHYGGFRGAEARHHFRAVMAHVAAHAVHSRQKFPVGTLKPVQVTLVGLIEDARVEALAIAEFPGLARLWRRFHYATPASAFTAEQLMARLSRALIDPTYKDDDPWVNKGRLLFSEQRANLGDPAISRAIGGLLGNDIGQMRIQFNPRTHIVEPSYRDDNMGLWDFGDQPPEHAETAEMIVEAVRIREEEKAEAPERRERSDGPVPPAGIAARMKAVEEDEGLPLAKLPEWDHISGVMRQDWVTVLDHRVKPASSQSLDDTLRTYAAVEARIARLVGAAKVSRPERMRRQRQGDQLDYDACISATIERRLGRSPDPFIYETRVMRARDLSVLLLLDISESTRDRVRDTTTTVLTLGEAMAGLGDPFAIHAFCSNSRDEVRYYRVKDFAEPYGAVTRARLAGLRGMLSTRLGAALRQAGAEVSRQPNHRRLVLVVTDGEPSDVDVVDRQYLVEDCRKAVQQLSHLGVDVFGVGLDGGGESYLARIFGRRNYLVINRLESLPEKLPMLYFHLTR
jgi:fructose-specific component phosphotransferase system IIB-like protein